MAMFWSDGQCSTCGESVRVPFPAEILGVRSCYAPECPRCGALSSWRLHLRLADRHGVRNVILHEAHEIVEE